MCSRSFVVEVAIVYTISIPKRRGSFEVFEDKRRDRRKARGERPKVACDTPSGEEGPAYTSVT